MDTVCASMAVLKASQRIAPRVACSNGPGRRDSFNQISVCSEISSASSTSMPR